MGSTGHLLGSGTPTDIGISPVSHNLMAFLNRLTLRTFFHSELSGAVRYDADDSLGSYRTWFHRISRLSEKRKAMMFRRKLLAVFALTVFLSVAAVALLVSAVTRRAFERSEDERTAALVTQFRREFNRQGEDVARRVEAIAASEDASRMAVKLNRPQADAGPYFELAKTTAANSRTRLFGVCGK